MILRMLEGSGFGHLPASFQLSNEDCPFLIVDDISVRSSYSAGE